MIPRHILLQPQHKIRGVWRRDIEYRHADGSTILDSRKYPSAAGV